MQIIPIQALPSQIVSAVLGGQQTRLSIRTNSHGMFIDVYVSDALIIGSVVCENGNKIVRDAYLGFLGDLGFYDTQGTRDPTYDGLGTRYLLVYLEATDLP